MIKRWKDQRFEDHLCPRHQATEDEEEESEDENQLLLNNFIGHKPSATDDGQHVGRITFGLWPIKVFKSSWFLLL
jgi:hypothetical protein